MLPSSSHVSSLMGRCALRLGTSAEGPIPAAASIRCGHSKMPMFNLKTGRGCGIAVTQGRLWRVNRSNGRVFQMVEGKRYGFDVGLEDRIILKSLGTSTRKLDEKKRRQLGTIFETRLTDVLSSNDALAVFQLEFSKVQVNASFTEITVSWIARGGQRDTEVRSALDRERSAIRRELSHACGTSVPEITFRPDLSSLNLLEMDALFARADYGMDYKALSHSGRVLGALKEEEEAAPPKNKKSL